jgi:hypothetical protein
MANWQYLQKYNLSKVIDKFPRKTEIEEKYKKDETIQVKLNYIKEMLKMNDYYLIPNDYPYDVSEDINHYVFWYKNIYSLEDALKIALSYFKKTHNEIIVFVNDITNKSVLDINHYHIFVKNT